MWMYTSQQNSKMPVIQIISLFKLEDMKSSGAQKMILDTVRNRLTITTDLPSKVYYARILGRETGFRYKMMVRTF